MTKTIVFENIGWGKYASSKIIIKIKYKTSFDYDNTRVYVDGKLKASGTSTVFAIEQALDPATSAWLIRERL